MKTGNYVSLEVELSHVILIEQFSKSTQQYHRQVCTFHLGYQPITHVTITVTKTDRASQASWCKREITIVIISSHIRLIYTSLFTKHMVEITTRKQKRTLYHNIANLQKDVLEQSI